MFCSLDSIQYTHLFAAIRASIELVGYGDITPATRGGKLFATVYILVAGTILLNNMSMISMIPLELRKRRIEKAVLSQVCRTSSSDSSGYFRHIFSPEYPFLQYLP